MTSLVWYTCDRTLNTGRPTPWDTLGLANSLHYSYFLKIFFNTPKQLHNSTVITIIVLMLFSIVKIALLSNPRSPWPALTVTGHMRIVQLVLKM